MGCVLNIIDLQIEIDELKNKNKILKDKLKKKNLENQKLKDDLNFFNSDKFKYFKTIINFKRK